MRKGFTLVELLAVIVILAVIALITIPAVLKMIDNATINSYRRSIDLYGGAVNNGIISYESDMVEKGKKIDITFENIDSYIEYEGNDVDCKDKTIYSDRTILLTQCYVQEELVHAEKGRGYGEENYYYYTNSKKKMKLIKYIEAVEEAIQGKNISGTCTIGEDKITCNNEDITIKSKLENAIEGTLTIENNKVKSYSNMRFATEKKTETNNEVPQVIDEQNTSNNNTNNQTSTAICKSTTGTVSTDIGTKYECEVKPGTKYNFYVLSVEGDKVNLIMDRNICNDGTTSYTSTNNYCRYKWNSSPNNNNYGPTIVMAELYAGTKDWYNVPTIELSGQNKYTDEANSTETDKGYISLEITGGVAIITGKIGPTTPVGTSAVPVRARLSKYSEVYGAGCTENFGSCPTWLMEYMTYYDVSDDKYSMNNNSEGYQNQIYGYWLLSSDTGYYCARYVGFNGHVNSTNTANVYYGARPVITVSLSDLSA